MLGMMAIDPYFVQFYHLLGILVDWAQRAILQDVNNLRFNEMLSSLDAGFNYYRASSPKRQFIGACCQIRTHSHDLRANYSGCLAGK